MPFYEYITIDVENACDYCYNIFEVRQSIKDNQLDKCPRCGSLVRRVISLIGGAITKGKEVNQFSDVKNAKYWRDSNGVRHKVTPQDGKSWSPTITHKKTATPEVVEARKKIDASKDKKRRVIESRKRQAGRSKKG